MFYRGSCTRLVPGLVGFFAENLNVLDADADVFVGNSAVPWGSLPLVLAIPVHVLQPPVRLGFASGSFLSSPVHWVTDSTAAPALDCETRCDELLLDDSMSGSRVRVSK